ncbi:MAG: hypothetical protein GXP49_10580 [Deltaproteobacteria bacterium]|nr:hypothetical protein [Deltaproteobacteria bacterium]
MNGLRHVLYIDLLLFIFGCAAGNINSEKKEHKFYKSPAARHCLEFEKKGLDMDSRACWSRLLNRIEQDPAFRETEELSEADIEKVRRKVVSSSRREARMRGHWNKCLSLPPNQRQERLSCFKKHLALYRSRMTRADRFEVENAIQTIETTIKTATGDTEDTIEHVGKLLGADLSIEDEGIRIHRIASRGIMKEAAIPEESIIVLAEETRTAGLAPDEKISILESCEDRPIRLLVRHGGLDRVKFFRFTARCGKNFTIQDLSSFESPPEVCTTADSLELGLGISWCYLPVDGILEIEEVCLDSPGARAGVKPGQQVISINGQDVLGKSFKEIKQLVGLFPGRSILLGVKDGSLESPGPITGPALDDQHRHDCWKAIESTLDTGH